MKKLVLLLAVMLSVVSCGDSSSSSKNNPNTGKPTQERITQSVNSEEGQILIAHSWCTELESIDDNEVEYLAQWKMAFTKSGDFSFIIKNLDTNQVKESETGFWTINGTRLALTAAGEIFEIEFSVRDSLLILNMEFENEDGTTGSFPIDFNPCNSMSK